VTISAVGSLIQARGTGVTTLSAGTPVTGNVLVLAVRASSASVSVSSVSGGLVTTWTRLAGSVDALTGSDVELFMGTVTGSGSSTITVSFSASVASTSTELLAQQFQSSISGASWAVGSLGAVTDGMGTAVTFPSQTSTASALYFGYAFVANTAAAGATTGFTYTVTTAGNLVTYNPAATGTVAPTASQSPSGNWVTVGAFLVDVAPVPASLNANYPVIEELWGPSWTAAGGAFPQTQWTNLVDRTLTQASSRRGKQYELDQAQAGDYQIVLGSQDGVLDPTNTAGPFGGKILPYQPYRRRAQWPPTANILTPELATAGEGYIAGNIPASFNLVTPSSATIPGVIQTLSAGYAYQGSNVFRFAIPANPTANSGVWRSDIMAVRPGKKVTFSLYLANGTASTTSTVLPYIAFLNADGTTVWGNGTTVSVVGVSGQPTWSRATVTTTAPTTGAVYGMRIGMNIPATGMQTAASNTYVDGIQVEWGSTATAWVSPGKWYPIFSGFTERWPTQWVDGGTYGQVSPTAVDSFALLSQITLDQVYLHELKQYSPKYVYKLSEGAGSAFVTDAVGNNPPVYAKYGKAGSGNWTFGNAQASNTSAGTWLGSNETVLSARPSGAGSNSGGPGTYLDFSGAGLFGPDNGAFTRTIAFRYMGGSAPTGAAFIWGYYSQIGSNWGVDWLQSGVALIIDTDGHLKLKINIFGSTAQYVDFGASVIDGDWHHAAFSCSGSSVVMSIDGVTSLATVTGTIQISTMNDVLGARYNPYSKITTNTFYGDLAYAAEYETALGPTQFVNLYNAWKTACQGESSGARYARILRYAGFAGGVNTDTGNTTSMGPATDIVGGDAMTALSNVVQTENGSQFVGADGSITFRSRGSRYNSLAPVYTFGDGVGEYRYEDLQLDFDSTHLSNSVAMTQQTTGSVFSAQDSASIASYFTRTLTRTLNTTNALECQDASDYYVSRYKQPLTRVNSIKLHPSANPSLWPVLLSLELGTRIRINRRPPGAPTITVDCFVEQISWDMDSSNEAWVTLQCSPIDPVTYAAFGAFHTTLNTAAAAGATSITLNNGADNTNPLAAQIPKGAQLYVGWGTPNQELVTVTTVATTSSGWTTAACGISALTNSHSAGEIICEPLPSGYSDPTYWDATEQFDKTVFAY
jgi:hypothetical protein